MKKIIINENQIKYLKEAINYGFSFERLKQISSFNGRMNFCKEYLGDSIGRGSSRLVFQIDDEWVLKLAMNGKGVAQNEEEYYTCLDSYNPISVNVNKNLSDTKDFKFIVSEFVLKAKNEDFEHIVGMSFEEFNLFLNYAITLHTNHKVWGAKHFSSKEYDELIYKYEDLRSFDDYIGNYDLGSSTIGDMRNIANYGIVNRDGYATIVMLDTGLNDEIYNNFYMKKDDKYGKFTI